MMLGMASLLSAGTAAREGADLRTPKPPQTITTGVVTVVAQAESGARSLVAPSQLAAAPGQDLPLEIQVGAPGNWPGGSFLRIFGLPRGATINEGFSIAPSLWAVPLTQARDLKMRLPPEIASNPVLQLAIATVEGNVLAESRTTIVISRVPGERISAAVVVPTPQPARPRGSGTTAQANAAPDPAELAPPPESPAPAETLPLTPVQQRATGFITRGQEQLADGNIAAARLLFQRAADAGLAYGALFLAETYDPNELALYKVRGIAGDISLARTWYEKARALGAPEAEQRLKRLGGK
jgi:hypothetical protein